MKKFIAKYIHNAYLLIKETIVTRVSPSSPVYGIVTEPWLPGVFVKVKWQTRTLQTRIISQHITIVKP